MEPQSAGYVRLPFRIPARLEQLFHLVVARVDDNHHPALEG
jgi:hypothetical protein